LFQDHANAACYFFLQLRCQISPHYPILKGKVSSIFPFWQKKKNVRTIVRHPPDSKSFSIFSLPVSSQKTFEPVQDNKQSVYIRRSMLLISNF